MAYMAGQFGGYGMLRFTKQDLYNYVHGQRVARICDGDAAVTISYLKGKENADMRTVARYTRTSDNCLGSLIWADGEMMMDYQLFGDVLAFDLTYRSNKYRKPLVVFSGTNHHKQTSILVMTDGDKAMRTAIAEVMPMATHRLCGWHLEKNCVQRVKDAATEMVAISSFLYMLAQFFLGSKSTQTKSITPLELTSIFFTEQSSNPIVIINVRALNPARSLRHGFNR
ncbi:hypothetical protein AHAS_Ahas04G0069700 [Arachis hypogaea]